MKHNLTFRHLVLRLREALTLIYLVGPYPSLVKDLMRDRKINNSRKPKQTAQGPMLPKTRKVLEDFHRPWNEKLADLLQDERFLWQ